MFILQILSSNVNIPNVASFVPSSPSILSEDFAYTDLGISLINHNDISRLCVPETAIGVRKRLSWVNLNSFIGPILFMKVLVTAQDKSPIREFCIFSLTEINFL